MSDQCKGVKKNGEKCANKAKYCGIHAPNRYFRSKKSSRKANAKIKLPSCKPYLEAWSNLPVMVGVAGIFTTCFSIYLVLQPTNTNGLWCHALQQTYNHFDGEFLKETDSKKEALSDNFGQIRKNIIRSYRQINELQNEEVCKSYLIGLEVQKIASISIRDHVENPTQTPLKDGSIRVAAGKALFGLPLLFEAMKNTIESHDGEPVVSAKLQRVHFNVNG